MIKQALLIISLILFQTIYSQDITAITNESLQYDGTLGIGWGVFSIIIAIIFGVFCCILGVSTLYPGIFISIGFCLPISIFLFMAFVPLEQPGNLNLKDNPAINNFIVVKWFYFTLMTVGVIIIFIPFFSLWSGMIIPQRVDSRAQREYYEKYDKLVNQEKLKIDREKEIRKNQNNYNNENAEILLPIRNPNQNMNMNMNLNENNENIIENNREESNPEKRRKFLQGLRRRKPNEENLDE